MKAEQQYRAVYSWYLRNDEDPAGVDDASKAAASAQSGMVAKKLADARAVAACAGVTAERTTEIETEERVKCE